MNALPLLIEERPFDVHAEHAGHAGVNAQRAAPIAASILATDRR